MNDRRILFTCLVLILVVCLLITCIILVSAGLYFFSTTSTGSFSILEDFTNPQVDSRTIPEETPEIYRTPSDQNETLPNASPLESEIDPETSRQMDEIQMQVILERGLKPSQSITRNLYSPEQLREKIIEDFFENYSVEDANNEALTLASFGLLEPEYDLHTFYTDLYSEQIAGFFDIETKEMVVVQGEDFGGAERFVYAHEYTHVLQDQNFDLENGLNFNDDSCEDDSERCSAILALIEGDATLTQSRWFFSNSTTQDQADLLKMMVEEADMPIFDSAPEFITLSLTFPYESGYMFVDHLYNIGGWGTINRAYQDPPLSTEQILHPDRYPDDKPVAVNLPDYEDILGLGWEEIDRGIMGEWYTYLILAKGLDENARLEEDRAKLAAEGWGGDAYVVYYKADTAETIMVLKSTWDTPAEGDEFADAFRDYANGRFGTSNNDTWQDSDGYHYFNHQADTTTWILAPNADIITEIRQTTEP